MTPYAIGDRVVCLDPDDGGFVGTIDRVIDLSFRCDGGGARVRVVVSGGGKLVCVDAEQVRPVMPRDRHDLERWGRWWWLDERPVWVVPGTPLGWADSPWIPWAAPVDPAARWRGPVAPPPEVP